MKQGLAQITVVLDRSGSMDVIRDATISGFNEFIEGQKNVPGEARATLIQFDSTNPWEVIFADKPIMEVPKLTRETFVPRDSTPLHDAIGRTIVDLGAKLSATPEDHRPERVFVVIVTDGLENASREFSATRIAEMIKHQREIYKWEFVFLGANQDAILTAKGFNIPANSTMSYAATAAGSKNMMHSTSANVARSRVTGQSVSYSAEDRRMAMEDDENKVTK
jgi:hypothetical protein